ncbi:MAG: hypothetical protein CL947_02225 [Epsilonproteobacteria bacterium]|nr:hypothetical protein [Campylobacterota bacterium]|tara:strand:- start:463 stop:915 length:453 start_codon:yes stop_codon:yes gene_type:complete
MLYDIIQETIQQFSLRTLYLEMLWFMTFGYLMHIFVVMGLTKLPFIDLVKGIFRLQVTVVLTSFLVAPCLAGLSIVISEMLSANYTMWFVGQQVYTWFVVSMMFVASDVLCNVFVTIPCTVFRRWLVITNAGVGILGFFVLKAMNLLSML